MDNERKELLERLRRIKDIEEDNLEMLGQKDKIKIDDVKCLGEVELKYNENGKEVVHKINVYAVIEGKTIKYYSDDMPLAAETEGIGKNKQYIIPSQEYEKIFEKENPIRDIIENLKQKEIEEQERSEEERTIKSLNDLENEEKKDKEKDGEDSEEIEDDELKESNNSGATSLDQMIDGVTLRNILQLDGDYEYIKPISASKVRAYTNDISSKDAIIAIKRNGECTILDDSVITMDEQEGINSADRDLNIENDGSVGYKSNTSSYRIVSRPGYYVSVGFDEGSTNKEIKISRRSGRTGDEEVEFELQKRGASEYEDSDARKLRQENEDGIEKSESIYEKQRKHEDVGCENREVRNIDNYEENNSHSHIKFNKDTMVPGKKGITVEQWSEELGDSVDTVVDRLNKEIAEDQRLNRKREMEDIIKEVETDYEMMQHTSREKR